MRLVVLSVISAVLAGAAFAQPAPRVAIEDDVAPAKAVTCAALRMAQVETAKRAGKSPDALVVASLEAWLSSGVDAAKAKAESASMVSATPAKMASMSDDCATFEIRSVSPAGS